MRNVSQPFWTIWYDDYCPVLFLSYLVPVLLSVLPWIHLAFLFCFCFIIQCPCDLNMDISSFVLNFSDLIWKIFWWLASCAWWYVAWFYRIALFPLLSCSWFLVFLCPALGLRFFLSASLSIKMDFILIFFEWFCHCSTWGIDLKDGGILDGTSFGRRSYQRDSVQAWSIIECQSTVSLFGFAVLRCWRRWDVLPLGLQQQDLDSLIFFGGTFSFRLPHDIFCACLKLCKVMKLKSLRIGKWAHLLLVCFWSDGCNPSMLRLRVSSEDGMVKN